MKRILITDLPGMIKSNYGTAVACVNQFSVLECRLIFLFRLVLLINSDFIKSPVFSNFIKSIKTTQTKTYSDHTVFDNSLSSYSHTPASLLPQLATAMLENSRNMLSVVFY